ncbi:MAG: endolytic transglycosylase MltG [Candidatus Pacebacteria bacterium]|nr:endolytic transglycosylase MltG [Candidatus Paceibacterota bacterium]
MEIDRKIITLILAIIAFIFFAYISQAFFSPSKGQLEAKLFIVNKGEAVKEVASNLKKENLIGSQSAFVIYTGLTGNYSKIQAGEYLLSSEMSVARIVSILSKGETAKENITIVEGWDLRDINGYLVDKGIAKNEELYSLTGTPARKEYNQNVEKLIQKFDFLEDKPKNMPLEGYLFPDTYYIDKGDDTETIIEKALNNFGNKLTPDLRNEIKKQKKTIFEIVTMASIIEKEVRTINDKKIVSGILWKRMSTGMRLQVDATILYEENKVGLKIYTKDTQIDSPYNTYRVDGLPLGPISNPGMDSIVAAIYPTTTQYYYYLSARDGKTIFSKTLEEHNYNKAKYLK